MLGAMNHINVSQHTYLDAESLKKHFRYIVGSCLQKIFHYILCGVRNLINVARWYLLTRCVKFIAYVPPCEAPFIANCTHIRLFYTKAVCITQNTEA